MSLTDSEEKAFNALPNNPFKALQQYSKVFWGGSITHLCYLSSLRPAHESPETEAGVYIGRTGLGWALTQLTATGRLNSLSLQSHMDMGWGHFEGILFKKKQHCTY